MSCKKVIFSVVAKTFGIYFNKRLLCGSNDMSGNGCRFLKKTVGSEDGMSINISACVDWAAGPELG